MKKLLALLFTFVLASTVLTACNPTPTANDDPIVGTWKMVSAKAMGETITLEDFQKAAGSEEVPTIEFTGDHKVKVSEMVGESGEGAWEVNDGIYIITDHTGIELAVELENGQLQLATAGVILIFEKQE